MIALSPMAHDALKRTSRTFLLPIERLSGELQKAVGGAYLLMRAIDEIEDHPTLANEDKRGLLNETAFLLQGVTAKGMKENLASLYKPFDKTLPDVTLRLFDWVNEVPESIRHRVLDATGAMAYRMAQWVEREFHVETENDLDIYTYSVAGCIGVLLADIWAWQDGTQTSRPMAVAFGRGLQSVNILRNKEEDAERGVSFYPRGWARPEMISYAKQQLELAQEYTDSLPQGEIRHFCEIPLALAAATVAVIEEGKEKLTREEVNDIVAVLLEEE